MTNLLENRVKDSTDETVEALNQGRVRQTRAPTMNIGNAKRSRRGELKSHVWPRKTAGTVPIPPW